MKSKKWLMGLLTVLAVGTAISAGACSCSNENNSSSSSEPPEIEETATFSLYQTETKLLLGETLKINTTYDNLSDKVVAFSSSNPAVATVSEDGTVTGVTNGTTTITATCGEETATCLVEVWLGGKVPIVHFAQFDDNQTATRVGIGDILNFESTITFNGKECKTTLSYVVTAKRYARTASWILNIVMRKNVFFIRMAERSIVCVLRGTDSVISRFQA